MADNTQVSANPTIATDEIAGVNYQRIKVTWGADGTANDVSAANPLPVSVEDWDSAIEVNVGDGTNSIDVVDTGGAYNPVATTMVTPGGDIVSFSTPYVSTVTPTLDTNAYAAGDSLASAVMQFAGVVDAPLSGWITQMTVVDKSGGKPDIQFFFTRSSVTPSPVNTAFDISDSNLEKVVAVVDTADGTWYDTTSGSVCIVEPGRARPYYVDANGPLYCLGKINSALTFAASDIVVSINVLKD